MLRDHGQNTIAVAAIGYRNAQCKKAQALSTLTDRCIFWNTSMSQQKIFRFLCLILLVTYCAFAPSRYSTAMQDAHAIPQEVKDFIDSNPQGKAFIEMKDTSIAALQSRVDFLQAELEKISRLFAAYLRGPRKETHISGSDQTWLPFDSQEELDQARALAEAEAQ
jgi:hypothetical protein